MMERHQKKLAVFSEGRESIGNGGRVDLEPEGGCETDRPRFVGWQLTPNAKHNSINGVVPQLGFALELLDASLKLLFRKVNPACVAPRSRTQPIDVEFSLPQDTTVEATAFCLVMASEKPSFLPEIWKGNLGLPRFVAEPSHINVHIPRHSLP